MLGTAVLAAAVSALLFRDYREGFRMLYHLLDNDGAHSIPERLPRHSRRSLVVQLTFAAGCLASASIGYTYLVEKFSQSLGN
jgi:hypothetical protein